MMPINMIKNPISPQFVNSSTGGMVEYQPPDKPLPQIEGYSNLSLVKIGN